MLLSGWNYGITDKNFGKIDIKLMLNFLFNKDGYETGIDLYLNGVKGNVAEVRDGGLLAQS